MPKPHTDEHLAFSLPKTLKESSDDYCVLFFYPKDMTSGCTQEACDFQDAQKELKKLKAFVLGVSKDSVESHQKFKTKYALSYSLISDPDLQLIKTFGVWKEKSLYGRKYMGIERSTFILNSRGKIVREFRGVKVKGHVAEVIEALASLKGSSSRR